LKSSLHYQLTVDAKLTIALRENRPWRKLKKSVKAASIEQQVLDKLAVDYRAHGWGFGLNQR
jgi:hypothetical protein